jgi:hypothetical protein
MDVNGAKALKRRLGRNGDVEPQPARADIDLSEDAPPVYQWFGVRPPEAAVHDENDDESAATASFFRRLGFSFR